MTERTDEETVELIREWLQKYGLTIIFGIVIGLMGVGGYQWWQNHQTELRYQESVSLDNLRLAVSEEKYPAAEKIYQALQEKSHGNISELSGLVLAAGYQKAGKLDKALTVLQKSASEGKDLLVQQTARWQAANIAVSLQKYDEAEGFLSLLLNSPYAAQAQALQGYLYEKQGQLPKALQAYQVSLELAPNPIVNIEMEAVAAQIALQNQKKD